MCFFFLFPCVHWLFSNCVGLFVLRTLKVGGLNPITVTVGGAPCHMPQGGTVYFKLDDIDLHHGSNDLDR